MKKRILSLLLVICLMTTFLPAAVLAADGDVTYRYCDENGANWAIGTKSVGEYKTVTDSDTVWTDGWYVVDSDITIGSEETPQRVTVSGKVHLILKDGCELIINGGIQLEDDDTDITDGSPNELTVYAQSEDESTMGKLTATIANGQDAAIGATFISLESKTNCGTMTINGGIIEAKSIHGAGIGGAYSGGDGGIITVNGGIVKAESSYETGIGGGQCGIGDDGGDGGIFTINGGAVYAKGDTGIGGGEGPRGGDGGIITINGGYVKAEGGTGAGIGGARGIGYGGNSGTITISGGIVEAKSEMGAGIGGGYTSTVVGTCEKITITGGIVKAESVYGAGIGSARCDTGMFGNAGDIGSAENVV